jgi:hypothetical protein
MDLHQAPARGYQLDGVGQRKRTCRDQGTVLAKTMAGQQAGIGQQATLPQDGQHSDAGGDDGWLLEISLLERLGRTGKDGLA